MASPQISIPASGTLSIGPHPFVIATMHPIQTLMATLFLIFPIYESMIAETSTGLAVFKILDKIIVEQLGLASSISSASLALGFIWLACVSLLAFAQYLFTNYTLSESALVVESGILVSKKNTIRLSFISDIDISCALGEGVINTGTLVIIMASSGRLSSEAVLRIPYVVSPECVRDFIVQRALKVSGNTMV